MSRVLVVGAGYAGQLAATRLSSVADVTVVDARSHFVERVRLHRMAAGGPDCTHALAPRIERIGARFVQARVEGVDLADRVVHSTAGDLPYDALVLAVGSRTRRPPGPAMTLDEPVELAIPYGARVTVVGGGWTGLEIATELVVRKRAWVTLVTRTRWPGFADAARVDVRLEELGVEVRQLDVVGLESDRSLLSDGSVLPHDAAIWCAGFEASALTRSLGLPLDSAGRIEVNPDLSVPDHPEIVVAGDAAALSTVDGIAIRMGCVTAMPMGAHAADTVRRHLSGLSTRPFRFRYAGSCVDLGGGVAIAQTHDAHDRPGVAVAGRFGGLIKEAILSYTLTMLDTEARAPLYQWPRPLRPTPEAA